MNVPGMNLLLEDKKELTILLKATVDIDPSILGFKGKTGFEFRDTVTTTLWCADGKSVDKYKSVFQLLLGPTLQPN